MRHRTRLKKGKGKSGFAMSDRIHWGYSIPVTLVLFLFSLREDGTMTVEPLAIGVCSWSLQVKNVPELKRFMDQLGINVVQIACGDPHHAAWDEGDKMPEAARAAGFRMVGSMLGFPGEDYTTPQTIQKSGGFGDPALRPERIDRFKWALDRTRALGLNDIMLHAGFLPEPGDPDRKPFLDTLAQVSDLAHAKGVTVAFETGQETADLLLRTLEDLACPNLAVNFDPANMILYDKGDPIRAVEILGPNIRSVHVKDANRTRVPGTWGEEVPLGQGQANIKKFIQTLKGVGYKGPLLIEREVGDQKQRLADIAHGIKYLRECLAA
jgi:sugar phosphate isomerase/epimerase